MRWSLMKQLVLLLTMLSLVPPAISAADALEKLTNDQVKEAIENNLMTLFGFTKKPRINKDNVVIPKAMLDLYKRQTGVEIDTTNLAVPGRFAKSANTMRSFRHKDSPVDKHFSNHRRFRLLFPVESIPKSEKLQAAELHLSRTALSDTEFTSQHILVHDIVRPGIRGQQEPITRLIDSKPVLVHEDTIAKLDVTPAVERWLSEPAHNHGLLVVVVTPKSNSARCLNNNFTNVIEKNSIHVRLKRDVSDLSEWQKVEPVLYTFTDDGKYKQNLKTLPTRSRRAAGRLSRKVGHCRRHELYVDFSEVGWNDWIVAPPGYDAYYCSGGCPFPLSDHLNSTNHAIVQTLVNSVNPSAAPRACCVPTTMAPISMLYLDEENKVVLKNYQDMTILGCGCR